MATPSKHPNGTYYLRRQIPERLRPEMGGNPIVPSFKPDDAQRRTSRRGRLLAGAQRLDFVRGRPKSVWLKVCDPVLKPLFRFATPPVKRILANELALMDAWNVRVSEDSQRFHDRVPVQVEHSARPRGWRPFSGWNRWFQDKADGNQPQESVEVQ